MESENDDFVFCSKDLPFSNSAAFAEMKRRGELCDVTIKGKSSFLAAHRVILAAAIPYFKDSFLNTTNHEKEGEIDADEVDFAALELLIDYAYSSKVTITAENALSLLLGAEFLQLHQVRDACVEYLTKRLRSNNVFQVRTDASRFRLTSLVERCDRYIGKNFTELCQMDDFLTLPPSCVEEIIGMDDLNVKNEEIVFQAVMKWVKLLPSERQMYTQQLLSNVGMIFLSSQYLVETVSSEELIRTSSKCRELVEEVKNCKLMPEKITLLCSSRTRPRDCVELNQPMTGKYSPKHGMYAVCFNYITCTVNYYDAESDNWVMLSNRPTTREMYNAIALHGKIMVFADSEISVFNLETREWSFLESLFYSSEMKNMVLYKRKVYYGIGLSECEGVRSFTLDKENEWVWHREWKLNSGRMNPGVAPLAGYIYVTGGRIGKFICKSSKRYSPQTERCEAITPMLSRRWNHGSAGLNAKLYVCGGIDTIEITRSEVYDPVTNRWTAISHMKYPRSNFSLAPYNRKLYAVAGERTQNVEIYDPDSDEWKAAAPVPSVPLHFGQRTGVPRTFVKCSIVADYPN